MGPNFDMMNLVTMTKGESLETKMSHSEVLDLDLSCKDDLPLANCCFSSERVRERENA